jgi:dipeptidyl aminopeptidase/acylaminoacyl peptidase
MTLAEGVGRPITALKSAPSSLTWSPNGTQIAFAAQVDSPPTAFKGMPAKPEGATWAADAKVTTSFTYRTNESGYLTPGTRQLFVVAAGGGAPRQLTKGDRNQIEAGEIAWTKDGGALIVASSLRPDAELRARESDLRLVPLDGSAPRALTDFEGGESDPALSPDGRTLAYIGSEETPTFYAQPDLWVQPLAGGPRRNLTRALDRPVIAAKWADDGRGLYVHYYDAGVTRVALMPLAGSAKPRVLVREVGGTRVYLPSSGGQIDAEGGTIAYTTLRTDGPAGLGISRGGREIASFDPNAEWRAGKTLGRIEEVRYKSRADGREIQGWLVFPPDFDASRKYPLALEIHGGPNTDYGPMFGLTHQLYASAGYIVLYTNPRGSIGYGREFANFFGKPYPSQDHDDLMSGVDEVAKRPYVDANNLFIGGGSGGGVLTLWALGQEPGKFRAASALRPVTDWTVQTLASDIQSLTARYWIGGTPWDNHEAYWRQSPLSLVGKVKTPTILITGEADYRTPIAQTEMYYQALKLRGVDAMKIRLPEANHGMGRPSQWLTSILSVIDWYDRYKAK